MGTQPPTMLDRLSKPRRGGLLLVLVLALLLTPLLPLRVWSAAAASQPPLPVGWPVTLQLGMADSPGGAVALKQTAPFGFRYQYLAGGVNTGGGWATWNSDGQFVTYYIQDSVANNITPVFTYYMIYQSQPGGGGEANAVSTNLRNVDTMRAYYNDLKLFFQRAGAFSSPVVLHVEPDMWGYIQQAASGDNATTYAVKVASTGLPELAGLPENAAGLAQAIERLRDQYAPHVRRGYHVSIWGTGVDIQYSQTSDATTEALAGRAATFYRSLGVDFDLSFAEFSDRDSGFYQQVYGDGGRAWFDADDFRRHARFMKGFSQGANERLVLWQIPMGNTKMRAANNTWNHYQDNRVEWLLDDATRVHLDEYLQAGVIAFLFGRGADGVTCACDANGDGVTNPQPINGNDGLSLTADDDGGFFRQKAAAYYAAGALPLPGGGSVSTPTPTSTPSSVATATPTTTPAATNTPSASPSFTSGATISAATVAPGGNLGITSAVTSATTGNFLVDVEIYGPSGAKVHQQYWDNQSFAAGETKSFTTTWVVPTTVVTGAYSVKIGVFAPGWGTLHHWNSAAGQFSVGSASSTATPTPTSTPVATNTPAPTNTPAATATPTPTNGLADTTLPARPVITSPSNATKTRNTSYTISGAAEANALVRVWADANNNGLKDSGEQLVASGQLSGGATAFSISARLTAGVANEFVVTARDAAGNESLAADVPTITSTRRK